MTSVEKLEGPEVNRYITYYVIQTTEGSGLN